MIAPIVESKINLYDFVGMFLRLHNDEANGYEVTFSYDDGEEFGGGWGEAEDILSGLESFCHACRMEMSNNGE